MKLVLTVAYETIKSLLGCQRFVTEPPMPQILLWNCLFIEVKGVAEVFDLRNET